MKNVLVIKSSLNGNASLSSQLVDQIVKKLKASGEDIKLTERDVAAENHPHLDGATYATFRKPEAEWSSEDRVRAQYSETLIAELKAADVIVIGIPMHQFTIPSTLKTWLDYASRAGKTFSYSAAGVEGLLKNKKVYLAIATGGVYSGPMAAMDFTENYMRTVLGFWGLKDVRVFRVEGIAVPDLRETALSKAIESVTIA